MSASSGSSLEKPLIKSVQTEATFQSIDAKFSPSSEHTLGHKSRWGWGHSVLVTFVFSLYDQPSRGLEMWNNKVHRAGKKSIQVKNCSFFDWVIFLWSLSHDCLMLPGASIIPSFLFWLLGTFSHFSYSILGIFQILIYYRGEKTIDCYNYVIFR